MITRINNIQRFQTPQTPSESPKAPVAQPNFQGKSRQIGALKIMAGTCMIAGTLGLLAGISTAISNNKLEKRLEQGEFDRNLMEKSKELTEYLETDTSKVSRAKTERLLLSKPKNKFNISDAQILKLEADYLHAKRCSISSAQILGTEGLAGMGFYQPTANYLKELQKFKLK